MTDQIKRFVHCSLTLKEHPIQSRSNIFLIFLRSYLKDRFSEELLAPEDQPSTSLGVESFRAGGKRSQIEQHERFSRLHRKYIAPGGFFGRAPPPFVS